METKDLLRYIGDNGFRSLEDIKESFASEDPEVLETNLSYMVGRNQFRKIEYQDNKGQAGVIFYIPKGF